MFKPSYEFRQEFKWRSISFMLSAVVCFIIFFILGELHILKTWTYATIGATLTSFVMSAAPLIGIVLKEHKERMRKLEETIEKDFL